MQLPLIDLFRPSWEIDAARFEALFVQKLPASVKKSRQGSVRPPMTVPHRHSR
jgi:hypothetical protein